MTQSERVNARHRRRATTVGEAPLAHTSLSALHPRQPQKQRSLAANWLAEIAEAARGDEAELERSASQGVTGRRVKNQMEVISNFAEIVEGSTYANELEELVPLVNSIQIDVNQLVATSHNSSGLAGLAGSSPAPSGKP